MSEQKKEERGITNIVEVITLVFVIVKVLLVEIRRDGFQLSDIFVFLSSEDFKAAIGPAVKDITEIKDEIKDFSLAEGFEIVNIILSHTKDIIHILTKK
jgi:hypothetical protein